VQALTEQGKSNVEGFGNAKRNGLLRGFVMGFRNRDSHAVFFNALKIGITLWLDSQDIAAQRCSCWWLWLKQDVQQPVGTIQTTTRAMLGEAQQHHLWAAPHPMGVALSAAKYQRVAPLSWDSRRVGLLPRLQL
jgi:hypothetical protein